MRYLSAFLLCTFSLPVFAAEVTITSFTDALGLESSHRRTTVYVDGNVTVDGQKLPVTLQLPAKPVDLTICDGTTIYCDSIRVTPDNNKPLEVGFFVQTNLGNIYYKALTGGGLKVIKDKTAAAEAQAKAIEDAKRNEAKP